MAIDFPISPSVNDEYSYGGRTWRYNGTAWESVTAAYGPTGATGPTGPTGPAGATGPTPPLSSNTPQALGSASAGTGTNASKDDHVHPTTGLGLTSGKLSQFASTSSSELAGVISDETGSGSLVFGTSPTISTSLISGSASFDLLNTTATTINFGGAATTIGIGAANGTVNFAGGLTATGNVVVNTDQFIIDNVNDQVKINYNQNYYDGINYSLIVNGATSLSNYHGNFENVSDTLEVLHYDSDAYLWGSFYVGLETVIINQDPNAFSNQGTTIRSDGTDITFETYGSLIKITDQYGMIIQGNSDAPTPITVIGPPTHIGGYAQRWYRYVPTVGPYAGPPGNFEIANITYDGSLWLYKDLTVNGNLIINGTTTTVNSTIVSIDDPIFTLGGDTAPTTDDNKDRGIEFRWHNGTAAKVGFFGFDDSTGKLTFIPDATNTSEVFAGTLGTIDIGAVHINGSQIAASNLSNGTTGTGTIVLAASPTFTGVPLSTTAAVDTNTTQIATTAFVLGQAASANPTALGSVSVGTSTQYARADHVHPTTGLGLTSGTLGQFAATTSAQLASVISDETGSGALVFATSPTLTTPNIGVATGTSFNSITGLSSTNPTALGTVAVGTATTTARADHVHPTTGLGLTSGTLAQFAATTSAQLAGVISDETGSGSLVFATSPTLVTPNIGAATGTSFAATGGTINVRSASTQDGVIIQGGASGTTSLNITLIPATLSSSRTLTLPDTTGTVVTTGDNQTVTSTMILDGTIVNGDINASAAIAHSKLANASAGQILLGTTTTGVITATTVSGDITITGAGVTAIGSGVIVNADINASAAIALSKLASGTSGQIIIANASGVPTYTTISGDITISNTGVVAIAANSVELGTDTTGNYVASLVAGTGITLTNNSGEGATPTVAIGQDVSTTSNVTFSTVSAGTVTITNAPSNSTDAATKSYVDQVTSGINWHLAANLATAAVLPNSPSYVAGSADQSSGTGIGATLTATTFGQLSIDGTLATTGQRVLVKNQANAIHNGVYDVTQQGSAGVYWVLTRATDSNNSISGQVKTGDAVYVLGGSTNINQGFIITSSGSLSGNVIRIGTDNITWSQFTGTSSFTAGTGLSISGNTLNVGTASATRIVVNADDIDLATVSQTNATGTAGISFVQSHTVDSYGRVSGTVTADVRDATTSVKGIASFNSADFTVATGAVSISNVNLGTQTTGSYVASLVAGTGVTLSNNSGEGATPTIAIGQAVETTSNVTFNNLTVSGTLTVNGTTTTVNSTVTTVDDPVITLGGDTAPTSDDGKDRGIEFRWHNGVSAKVGFFGFDDSTGKLTFIPDATNTSEVFAGTLGTIDVGAIHINGSQIAASNLSNGTTGSGSIVLATSPSLTTPTLGVASATSINKVTITTPATGSTLTIADGKTLTVSNTLTFTGTDASSVAFGTGGTVAYTSGTLSQFATSTTNAIGVGTIELGHATDTTLARSAAGVVTIEGVEIVTLSRSQSLTNKTISGSSNTISNIANSSLTNSSVTINGTAISLGGTATITAAAGTLTGTTLNSTVVSSSLTSVGTITTGTWQGSVISATYLPAASTSAAGVVQLNNTNTSNSTSQAATANALRELQYKFLMEVI